MNKNNSNTYLSWLGGIILALFLLMGLIFSVTPLVVRWAVADWFSQQGLVAEIGYLEISPGTGRVNLHDISVEADDGQRFALDALVLDIAPWRLLDHQLVIERLRIEGGHLDVRKQGQQWQIAGLDLASLGKAPEVQAVAEQQPQSSATPWSITVKGLAVDALELCLQQASATGELRFFQCVGLEQFTLRGDLDLLLAEQLSAHLPDTITLSGFQVDDRQRRRRTFAFNDLVLRGLDVEPGRAYVDDLILRDVAFAERQGDELVRDEHPYHGRLNSLRLDEVEWQKLGENARVSLAGLTISGMDLLLQRDPEVNYPLLTLLGDLSQAFQGEETAQAGQRKNEKGAGPTAINVDNIEITDASRLAWFDEGVSPVVRQSVSDLNVQLSNVDNTRPGHLSPLRLTATIGDFGQLNLAGKLGVFSEKINLNLQGELRSLDLLPYTAYAEQAIGYRIERGLLTQKINLVVEQDQLDTAVDLDLHKFKVTSLGREELPAKNTDSETNSTVLPLGVALDLLRTDDDRIYFKMPVHGDIRDPDMSFGHIIGVLGRKALTQAVINYYTPFGLVSLTSMLASSATKMRFDPLVYPPGEKQPSSEVQKRLHTLATLLKERQQLSLVMCAAANGRDWSALYGRGKSLDDVSKVTADQQQGLRQLAQARGLEVKRQMLALGAQEHQVVLCSPGLKLRDTGEPQVSVEI